MVTGHERSTDMGRHPVTAREGIRATHRGVAAGPRARVALLTCWVLLCVAATPVFAASTRVAVGDREVLVVVPDGLDRGRPAPLLIALHGFGSGGRAIAAGYGLVPAAADAGIVLALPDGTRDVRGNRFWNAGAACCDIFGSGVDDVGFLLSLIDAVADRVAIDPARVYLFGESNGGFMAYRMACTHPERFAAVAVVAGALEVDPAACAAPVPLGVLHVHGTADDVIAFAGGDLFGVPFTGAEATVTRWAEVAGCGRASTGAPFDLDAAVAGAETVPTEAACPDGVRVALWPVKGGAHVPRVADGFAARVLAFLLDHARR